MEKKKDNIVKNALILMVITLIAGMLLGFTYEVTKEPIRVQQQLTRDKALKAVFEDADNFEEVENNDETGVIKSVFEAKVGDKIVGYAFLVSAPGGYGGNVDLMVGMDIETDQISGIDVIKHAETPGLGAKADEAEFKSEFEHEKIENLKVVKYSPSETEGEISAISGATITSKCVTGGVNSCVDYYEKVAKEGK